MIVGVDGKKTCVRSIVGFERINNDLMQFREKFFNRIFQIKRKSEKEKTKTNNTTTNKRTTRATAAAAAAITTIIIIIETRSKRSYSITSYW